MTWGTWRASVVVLVVLLATWPIEYSGALVDGTCGLTIAAAFDERSPCQEKAEWRLFATGMVAVAAVVGSAWGRNADAARAVRSIPPPPR